MIKDGIPHRYPFLFLDKVVESSPGNWAKGYKHVSSNEWFFSGGSHSIGMPAVLVVEAIAQLSAFATESEKGKIGMLTSLKGVEISRLPLPGDRLDLYFEVTRQKDIYIRGKGYAKINNEIVLSANEIGVFLMSI